MSKFKLTRRQWISALPATAGLAVLPFKKYLLASSEALPLTAESSPILGICHVGFRVDGKKRIILRGTGFSSDDRIQLVARSGASKLLAVTPDSSFDFGNAAVVDFSDVSAQDTYKTKFRAEESRSFPIATDAWKRILPVLSGYQHQQRCGYSFPGGRSACHRDDARRRDNGLRVDTTGGWHDAGDLRKWVDATLMSLFGLLALIRNLRSHPDTGALSLASLRAEARYGNTFFLKMQDVDGRVWADVAGGVNGDNSDNHWTDNAPGTSDDRWINVEKRPAIQAMFVTAQASMAQAFSAVDESYATQCLSAGVRCWNASTRSSGGTTLNLAWWVLAASELHRSTARDTYKAELVRLTEQLRKTQILAPQDAQTFARGFFPMWPGNRQPLRDPVHSALPAYALLRAADALTRSGTTDLAIVTRWKSAARTYIDDYLLPMTAKSAYGIVPFGLFWQPPSDENYRTLGGGYRYRFFMPVCSSARLWAGLNSHLLSHALLLAEAEVQFGDKRYRDMAYAQLEWVFGANPFGSSLVTGVGYGQPPAFSPFVGPISGGIMNGIAGDAEDQAVLDLRDPTDWRTNEYWSPHVGYCQWALSVLEQNS